MRTAGINPRGARVLEIRTALPHGLRYRQLGHRLFRLHDIYFVDEQTETIAEIHQRRVQRRSGGRVENQTRRISLAADAERMHLQRRLAIRDRRTNFQHVCAKHDFVAGL